jgi:hypothetical protein
MTLIGVAADGRTCTFRASRRSSVWQVTRDEVFYGDYLSREEALKSACSAARSFEAVGGTARVLASPGDVLIAHHPIDKR